jgi:hypothetical protein
MWPRPLTSRYEETGETLALTRKVNECLEGAPMPDPPWGGPGTSERRGGVRRRERR